MKRHLRLLLPDFTAEAAGHVKKRQQFRAAKSFAALQLKNICRRRDQKGWPTKAEVLSKVAPRSYVAVAEGGRELRRNRRPLLATPEEYPLNPSPEYYEKSLETPLQPQATRRAAIHIPSTKPPYSMQGDARRAASRQRPGSSSNLKEKACSTSKASVLCKL